MLEWFKSCMGGGFAGLLVGFFCGGFVLFFGRLIAYRDGSRGGVGLSVHDGRNTENAVKICMKFVIFDCIYCFGSILHMFI